MRWAACERDRQRGSVKNKNLAKKAKYSEKKELRSSSFNKEWSTDDFTESERYLLAMSGS
jgi:hypothetical protein